MRSNALNREFLEGQPCRLRFSNKRRRHACRYRIVLSHSESSIGAVRATKQPPAFKAGSRKSEVCTARGCGNSAIWFDICSRSREIGNGAALPGGRTDATQLLV